VAARSSRTCACLWLSVGIVSCGVFFLLQVFNYGRAGTSGLNPRFKYCHSSSSPHALLRRQRLSNSPGLQAVLYSDMSLLLWPHTACLQCSVGWDVAVWEHLVLHQSSWRVLAHGSPHQLELCRILVYHVVEVLHARRLTHIQRNIFNETEGFIGWARRVLL